MNVQPGTSLGPYEVLSRIGAGGIGAVLQARGTPFDRVVAVEVLPAANPQFKLRFERESKRISPLAHLGRQA